MFRTMRLPTFTLIKLSCAFVWIQTSSFQLEAQSLLSRHSEEESLAEQRDSYYGLNLWVAPESSYSEESIRLELKALGLQLVPKPLSAGHMLMNTSIDVDRLLLDAKEAYQDFEYESALSLCTQLKTELARRANSPSLPETFEQILALEIQSAFGLQRMRRVQDVMRSLFFLRGAGALSARNAQPEVMQMWKTMLADIQHEVARSMSIQLDSCNDSDATLSIWVDGRLQPGSGDLKVKRGYHWIYAEAPGCTPISFWSDRDALGIETFLKLRTREVVTPNTAQLVELLNQVRSDVSAPQALPEFHGSTLVMVFSNEWCLSKSSQTRQHPLECKALSGEATTSQFSAALRDHIAASRLRKLDTPLLDTTADSEVDREVVLAQDSESKHPKWFWWVVGPSIGVGATALVGAGAFGVWYSTQEGPTKPNYEVSLSCCAR